MFWFFGQEACGILAPRPVIEPHLLHWKAKNPWTAREVPHFKVFIKKGGFGTSLVVQWLRLHASHAGDMSSIPGWETKISHATGHQKKDKRWPFSRNQVPGESKTIHVTRKQQLHYTSSYYPLGASLVAQAIKNPLAMQETQVRSLGLEDPLEKRMATHSSILAWRMPWTEESGGLSSM